MKTSWLLPGCGARYELSICTRLAQQFGGIPGGIVARLVAMFNDIRQAVRYGVGMPLSLSRLIPSQGTGIAGILSLCQNCSGRVPFRVGGASARASCSGSDQKINILRRARERSDGRWREHSGHCRSMFARLSVANFFACRGCRVFAGS
jgi:hypothetical protein